MAALGLLLVLAGAFVANAVVKDTNPFTDFLAIIRNPGAAQSTLTVKGAAYTTSGDTSTIQNVGYVAPASGGTGGGAVSGAAGTAIAYARAQIGKPYRLGTQGPNTYDCSGLVYASYGAAGVKLPRTTAGLALIGSAVGKSDILPGDLIFPDPGHVQIATGSGYPTTIVEAPRTGLAVREVATWGFWTARRPTASGGTIST